MLSANIMGWDIGGAHIKAAIIKSPSEIVGVYQLPCQLWKGIDKLHEAAQKLLAEVELPIDCHVLTMTGELVDLFADRDDGVKQILAAMGSLLPDNKVFVYAGTDGLVDMVQVRTGHYLNIASANWLASATYTAQQVGGGLFVDIGSTTTDILLLQNNQVTVAGYTDYERLHSEELVYTGIVRTPVMAIGQSAQFEGKEVGLMAEYFATMADVYRVTGELNELHDQCETADGAEKTLSASAKRLARMIGLDYHEDELPRWKEFADNLRSQQVKRIQDACVRQMGRSQATIKGPLIGAGVGRFLVKGIAANLGLDYLDFTDLLLSSGNQHVAYTAADCAAAASVACLKGNDESPTH